MVDETVSLVLGDFYLHGGIDEDWNVKVASDEVSWGAPEAVDVTVQTLLQNSSSVVTDRYDNRVMQFKVALSAADGIVLAQAEAALFAELGKRNLLTWTPPLAYAPPTVFRVVTSSMAPDFDDLKEMRGWRVYALRLVCEAFARSVDEVTVEAVVQDEDPPAPVDTLVDNCSSTTGWSSAKSGMSIATSGGSIYTDPATGIPAVRRTGTIDMSATPYLVLDIKTPAGSAVPKVQINAGAQLSPMAIGTSPFTGYVRYWYLSPVTSITVFVVSCDIQPVGTGRLYIAEVRKQNSPPATGTLRQKFFNADVAGSAPSDGTLEVHHGTDGLGQVLLYTWPQTGGQGFTPALRELKSASGTTTSDTALVSGARNDIAATAVAYDIPGAQVTPGTYEVGAWMQSDSATARPVTVLAETVIGSTVVGSTTFTKSVDFDATSTWYYVPLGRVELPVNHLPVDTEATVRVTLSSSEASGIDVDEAYLFNVESGALTVVDCGDSTRLWVNSATLDWPMPSIMVGDAEDGTDSYSPADESVTAPGVHEITPPSINVFAVTPGALDAGVRLRSTPAWHTNAAS